MPYSRARFLSLLALAAIVAATLPAAAEEPLPEPVRTADSVAGQYLVHLDQAPSDSPLQSGTLEHLGGGIYLIREHAVGDPSVRAAELSRILGADVEPNRISRLFVDNPEPDAVSQWALDNFEQFVGGVADADIDGEEAWDAATGAGVVVAVIDSGADMDHPDLVDNLWVNGGEIPANGIDDDGNGFVDDVHGWDFFGTLLPDESCSLPPCHLEDADPEDTSGGGGHGSAVAGIIGAPINGVGMGGVAPDAQIMVLRACGLLWCPDATVIQSIYYAANNGADVINLSLGRAAGEHTAMEIAVQFALDAGVTVVAAAGNDGADNDALPIVPASLGLPGLVSVAMTDHADELDAGSNYGTGSVHLGAPGVGIWSLTADAGYGLWDGTSFAAPHTAAVAALLNEHQACLDPAQIASTIQSGGDALASLSGKTISGRRLNAFGALDRTALDNDIVVLPAPAPVTFTGGSAGTTWTFGDGGMAMGETARNVYDFGWYTADDGTDEYEVAAGLEFEDTCTSRFRTEIMWLSASGVTLGCDTVPNFCPDDTVIRSHMASFLARALDLPPATADYFTDDVGLSHEDNINRLREAGVTLGCNAEGTLFCPDDEVTRAQMATFLVRALGLPPSATDWFTDDDNQHEPNINALAESGITLGCDVGRFCPDESIERDEMAAFLFRGRTYLP